MPALSRVERFERIVVVTKKTALFELLNRYHSKSQVSFLLERRGTSIEEYEAANEAYELSLATLMSALPRELPHHKISREEIPTFLFRPTDLIIALGPDGLIVNVAKYMADEQPMIGVNPDPKRIDGVLVRFRPDQIREKIRAMLEGSFKTDSITLAKAETNDGQTLYAVNDFLVGRRDQVSAWYTVEYEGRRERQSSSGILISTGVGSSGWIKSVLTAVSRIASRILNEEFADAPTGENEKVNEALGKITSGLTVPFSWNEHKLLFVVRDPFPSRYTKADIVFGEILEGDELTVTSEMSEGGCIFSDGVLEDAIEFNAGSIVKIGVAERTAKLVAK